MDVMLVWDDEAPAPEFEGVTVSWSGFPRDGGGGISIPRLVEHHAEELREQFLAWVHDLGEVEVGGKAIVDHLELRPGFSYWWMTPLTHTPNYYQAAFITDIIKCLAFERLPEIDRVRTIRLHTRNLMLRVLMEGYCRARGLELQVLSVAAVVSAVPLPAARSRRGSLGRLSALAGLLRRKSQANTAAAGRPALCLFDMLVYLPEKALQQGVFQSLYWTTLGPMLTALGVQTTWVHQFFRHADVPSIGDARTVVDRFNASSAPGQRHLLVDGLSVGVLLSTVRSYLRLVCASWRLRDARRAFTPAGSHFDLWPVFRNLWRDALFGLPAARNCLTLAMYERLLCKLPYQPVGVYIQENQPWEMALLHAWRRCGHGRIIGTPHATVRFWDLRYFYDSRSYGPRGTHAVPMPDQVAVNGPAAREAYTHGRYPVSQLVDVEALRFLHQSRPKACTGPHRAAALPRILICGDNAPGSNERLIRRVAAAEALLPPGTSYVFKPHKSTAVDASSWPLRVTVTTSNLADLLDECDLVLTGSVTSASVDAFLAGRVVASMADGAILNASPFRGVEGVHVFHDEYELAELIRKVSADPDAGTRLRRQRFFYLDAGLPRWQQLLAVASTTACTPDRAASRSATR